MGMERPSTRGSDRPPSRGGATVTRGGHKVVYDERVAWDWKTHNQDWHLPKSARTRLYYRKPGSEAAPAPPPAYPYFCAQAEAKAMPIAGVKQDRKFLVTNQVERPETAMSGASDINEQMRIQQQASYGHQFSFSHADCGGSVLDGTSRLAKTSQSYGLGIGAETLEMVEEGNAWEQSKRSKLRGSLPPRPQTVGSNIYENANNNRNKWPGNISQIGEIIFGHEYEDGKPGVPTKRPSKSRGSSRGSSNARPGEYSAHPSYAPEANRYDPHFTTTKAAVDHEAVGLALEEDLYRNANPQGIGFRVYGKDHDDTTVSADSPGWFQLPGVTVNKLSAVQLGNLVQWGAPIPVLHTEPELINKFFGEEVEPCPIEDELYKKHSLTYDAHSRRAPLGGHSHEAYVELGQSGRQEQPPAHGEDDLASRPPSRAPSQASSVLSEANLEAHNRRMREHRERVPAPASAMAASTARESHAQSQPRQLRPSNLSHVRGSEASFRSPAPTGSYAPSRGRVGPRGDYPLPPRSAAPSAAPSNAFSQLSASSRRTASIYGQAPPPPGASTLKQRPATPLSASDLAHALKRAASGDEVSVARSGYTASVTASGAMRRPVTSHSSRSGASGYELAHRLREASSHVPRSVSARQ